jgi:ankyrin repeat protein
MQPSYGSVSDLVKDKAKCGVAMVESEAMSNTQAICNAKTNDMLSSLDFKSSTREGILKENVNMNDALHWAARKGQLEEVKKFLTSDQVDVNKVYPLWEAAQRGHLQVVKKLLANDQVDVNKGYPLRSAAQGGHLQVVKELLKNDQVDVNDGYPLCGAAQGGHLQVVK